jgi:hypothetical protein
MGGELTRSKETLDGTGAQGARKVVGMNEYLFAYVPASAVKGEVYVVTYDGDEETCPKLIAAGTLAVYQEVAVVLADQGASAGFAWVQTKGKVKMLVEGTSDVAKDNYLEVLNTEKSAKLDHASVRSVNSVAIACEAQTTNSDVLTDVILLGGRVIVAAT